MLRKAGFLILVLYTVLSVNATAQSSNEEQAVTEVINRLFKGMELGDSTMVRSTFSNPMTSATIFKDKSGTTRLHRESTGDGFVKAVGTPHADVWHEEIWNLKIQVDGDFAQAWCDYAFYAGKRFSHCGVDAFHLVKDASGWKIFHLADTRRQTGCNIPQSVQDKYK